MNLSDKGLRFATPSFVSEQYFLCGRDTGRLCESFGSSSNTWWTPFSLVILVVLNVHFLLYTVLTFFGNPATWCLVSWRSQSQTGFFRRFLLGLSAVNERKVCPTAPP